MLALAGTWTARATKKYLSQQSENSRQLRGKSSIVPVIDLMRRFGVAQFGFSKAVRRGQYLETRFQGEKSLEINKEKEEIIINLLRSL